jgi:RHS repeat-associated protein
MQLAAARSDVPSPDPLGETSGYRTLGDDPWVVEAARRRGCYGIKAYTGREWDPEINLYYYRARYYDPKLGRFISEDPDRALNSYRYAFNLPVSLTDPTGRFAVGAVVTVMFTAYLAWEVGHCYYEVTKCQLEVNDKCKKLQSGTKSQYEACKASEGTHCTIVFGCCMLKAVTFHLVHDTLIPH